jgi:hypothetical protein
VLAALERIRRDADEAEKARDCAEIRSRVAPESLPAGGGAKERRIESGRPALLPGV